MLEEYMRIVKRVMNDPRYLMNIKHPEMGWKVSKYELGFFMRNPKLSTFAIACRLMGLAVQRIGGNSIIIRRDVRMALRQLIEPIGSSMFSLRLDYAEAFSGNTRVNVRKTLAELGFRIIGVSNGRLLLKHEKPN